MYIADKYGEL